MPWFQFQKDFDWQYHPRAMRAYKAGMKVMVPTPCAERAAKAGAGYVLDERPKGLKTTKAGLTVAEPVNVSHVVEIRDGTGPDTND